MGYLAGVVCRKMVEGFIEACFDVGLAEDLKEGNENSFALFFAL